VTSADGAGSPAADPKPAASHPTTTTNTGHQAAAVVRVQGRGQLPSAAATGAATAQAGPKGTASAGAFRGTVRLMSGEEVKADFTGTCSVADVKVAVARSLRVSPGCVKLFSGTLMLSSQPLLEVGENISAMVVPKNIRVYCRIRPLLTREFAGRDYRCVLRAVDAQTVVLDGVGEFLFDRAWGPGSQQDVFDDCSDLVDNAIAGGRGCILVLGQAGTGRTFTTFGHRGNEGLVPRVAKALFERLPDPSRFSVTASFLEVHTHLSDLLDDDPLTDLRGWMSRGGMSEAKCACADDLLDAVARGIQTSIVANTRGSRHRMMIIRVTHEVGTGKLVICDLAELYSEQHLRNPPWQPVGVINETNMSLMALGEVTASVLRGARRIPYIAHALTELLEDCLCQSSKAVFVVTCTPASSGVEGTHQMLSFASRYLNPC